MELLASRLSPNWPAFSIDFIQVPDIPIFFITTPAHALIVAFVCQANIFKKQTDQL